MFFDLRKIKHFFTSELFILALDSKCFLNSILHKFVDLKEFRVRNISSAFVWTFLRFFDTRLAIVLSAMLALRRCFQDVVTKMAKKFYKILRVILESINVKSRHLNFIVQ